MVQGSGCAGGRGRAEILEAIDGANLSCDDKQNLLALAVQEAVRCAGAGEVPRGSCGCGDAAGMAATAHDCLHRGSRRALRSCL
eukprot:12578397-Alexandrium_andersonii.AAC.1